jgi:uncharacterized protein (DUF2147 family)
MRLRLTRMFAAAGIAAAAILPLGGAAPAAASLPFGRWLTPDGDGVIDVRPCGSQLCGRIVGMSEITRPDGRVPTDPDGNPQCGLTILHATAAADGKWSGEIENPDNGTTWTCEIWITPDGLHLRGYVLTPLLGQTQLWTHFSGEVAPNCRFTR